MRHVVVVLVAVVFWLLMHFFKQHKEKIMIGGIVVVSLISGVYTYTHADSILPKMQPKGQTFYDVSDLEKGEFPDAFLRIFLKGKTVYVKSDRMPFEEAQDRELNWLYSYYHVDNMVNYLNSVDVNVIEDPSINEYRIISDKQTEFERLGFLNDLLRNSMMYTKHDNGCGSYFFYLWYYRDEAKTSYLYANVDSLEEDELVILWQPQSDEEPYTEDMYLMGKNYFEENYRNQ